VEKYLISVSDFVARQQNKLFTQNPRPLAVFHDGKTVVAI